MLWYNAKWQVIYWFSYGATTEIIYLSTINLLPRQRCENVMPVPLFESWVRLVGKVEKWDEGKLWEDGKLFRLVREKKGMIENVIYIK